MATDRQEAKRPYQMQITYDAGIRDTGEAVGSGSVLLEMMKDGDIIKVLNELAQWQRKYALKTSGNE